MTNGTGQGIMLRHRIGQIFSTFSGVGLMLGTLFLAASLTPTLVPRTYLTQGALAGASFAAGYGIGVFCRWIWAYMELPEPAGRTRRVVNAVLMGLCTIIALLFLWRAAEWQNSIRTVMDMEPVDSAHPLQVCAVAAITFMVLFALARLFAFSLRRISSRLRRFLPRRVANVLGVAMAIVLFWSISNDVFFRLALNILDSSFRQYDALIEADRPQPLAQSRTGSPASLIVWEELGRAGREFIASGPGGDDIAAFTGRPARDPVRVYVGLRAAETPAARAHLALEELLRVGAFDRSALVVITPTGTGWIDPAAMDAVEYLHGGDIASVAMQYSYLSSPLSLIVQPEYGAEAARALFLEVYDYWTKLPKDRRPKLYLHGLSLGALNSERSAQLFEMISDPITGALWSGPPFESSLWRAITNNRNPGSPAWLPVFRDGSLVRFMDQNGAVLPADTAWGPMRVVYLQYASDPVTFFDYRDLYRPPAWLEHPRGSDVSPDLRWYPIVTMLQLALDMAVSTTTPVGHGHVYAPEHYVDAWLQVTDRQGWSADDIIRLKRHLTQAMTEALSDDNGSEDAYDNRGG